MRADTRTVKRARRLRRALSLPEVVLWTRLRAGGLDGLAFRRQHPCGPYILDFFCAEVRLAVEIDGQAHGHPEQAAHDQRRDRWLMDHGIRVLRIPARVLLGETGLDATVALIRAAANPPPPAGEGDPEGVEGARQVTEPFSSRDRRNA